MRIDKLGQRLNIDMRGKVGRAGGFGRVTFGYNTFGLYSFFFGIYQKKYYFGKPYISKSRFYRPTNSRTIKQQNWRFVHAYATKLWQSFDNEKKAPFEQKAKRLKMTGYNVFLKQFLKNKPRAFGYVKFGYGF